ncbi:MAG: hypothetical protein V4757_04000 [Pseudomonadota bacterium]
MPRNVRHSPETDLSAPRPAAVHGSALKYLCIYCSRVLLPTMAEALRFQESSMKSTPAGHKPLTQTPTPRAAGQAAGSSGANPGEMQVFGAQRQPVLPPRLLPLASPRHPTTAPDRSAWSGGGETVQLLAGLSDGARKGRLITGTDLPLPRGTRVTDGETASWLLAARTAELVTDAMDLFDAPMTTTKVFGLHYSFQPSSHMPDLPHLGRTGYNDATTTMLLGGNQGYMDGTFTSLFVADAGPHDVLAATMARDAADISDDEILFMQRAGKPGAVPPGYLVLLQGMPDEPGLRKLLTATLAFPASLRDIVSDYLTQPKTPHTAEGWRKLDLNHIVPVNGLLVMVCGRPKQQDGATTLDVFYPRTEGTQLGPPIKWDPRMLASAQQEMTKFLLHISPALPLEPALLRAHVGKEPPRPAVTRGDAKGGLQFRGHIYRIKLPDASDYPREMPLPQASPGKPGPSAMTSWNPLASWRKPAVVKPTGTAASGGLDTSQLQLRNDRPETERRVQVIGKDGVTRTGNLQPIAEDGEVWITFTGADFSRKDLAEHGIRWAHTTTAGVISCLINPDSFKLEWVNP